MKLLATLFLISSFFFTRGQGYGFEGQGRVLRDTGGMWTRDMGMEAWGGKVVVWEDLRMWVFNDCCEREVYEVVRDSVARNGQDWYRWVVKDEEGKVWRVIVSVKEKTMEVSLQNGRYERVYWVRKD